jgi:flavin reductase (DIM6/NTAB) family NADH-FMN oxidoreductase RutF
MSIFAIGITVIATQMGGSIGGTTANAFKSGSLEPPHVHLVCGKASVRATDRRRHCRAPARAAATQSSWAAIAPSPRANTAGATRLYTRTSRPVIDLW